jgi:hypothetical protein
MRLRTSFLHTAANIFNPPSIFCHLAVLVVMVQALSAQDRGNLTAQEYGDPVYRELGGFAGFLGYNYNHTAIFSGLDSNHNGRVRQALGSGYTTHEASFYTEFTSSAHDYYGAYTLNNTMMSFTDRKNIVKTASDLVNAAIAYPSTTLQAPVALVYYGSSFDGTVADISNIRCDGFVEYCYEKNNFRVWRNQTYADNTWSIVQYPDYHNDRPDVTRNPEREASPWAQRGAPAGPTGPQVVIDLGYTLPDTRMTSAAVIKMPTYQVTGVAGNGFVDVTVRATDESGIHYIGYKKPGDANWSYSPTQTQDPTSDSYSYTVRVTVSGNFYTFAEDNGGNYPTNSSGYVINVVSVPAAPTLASPSNGSTNVPTNPTLSWNASAGATSYRVQVSTSQTFSTTLVDDSTITGTSITLTGLANNTVYYWRVNSKNVAGSSAFSAIQNFSTIIAAPATPTLVAPTDGAIGIPVTTTLTWNATSGATTYRVQVSTSPGFAVTLINDSTLIAPSRQVGPLANGTIYYWRVSASNTSGTSAYSPIRGFTTIIAAPAAPIQTSPVDNAINTSLNPTLSWNPIAEATYYELQVSAFSNFPDYVYDDTTSGLSRTIGPLNLGTNYYWRVRARNAGGFGSFSSARIFKTILTSAVENLDGGIPREFALSQNYPNPFNPSTTISFALPNECHVSLKVFNLLGKEVATLVLQELGAGYFKVRWLADVPSGTYIYLLQAGGFVQTKKMILLK